MQFEDNVNRVWFLFINSVKKRQSIKTIRRVWSFFYTISQATLTHTATAFVLVLMLVVDDLRKGKKDFLLGHLTSNGGEDGEKVGCVKVCLEENY